MTPNQPQDDHLISSDEDSMAGPSGVQRNKKARTDTPNIILSTFTTRRTTKTTVDAQDETTNEENEADELPSVEED
jgi:hypothetical protein